MTLSFNSRRLGGGTGTMGLVCHFPEQEGICLAADATWSAAKPMAVNCRQFQLALLTAVCTLPFSIRHLPRSVEVQEQGPIWVAKTVTVRQYFRNSLRLNFGVLESRRS